MPTFQSVPLKSRAFNSFLKRNPAVFGVSFVGLIVAASFGLQAFTQTRYDLHNQKVKQVSREDELGLKKNRRMVDVREEYFRLSALANEDWEPKRIKRPAGVAEWGVPPDVK